MYVDLLFLLENFFSYVRSYNWPTPPLLYEKVWFKKNTLPPIILRDLWMSFFQILYKFFH